MKKTIALLLAVMMCLSLVACNAGNSKYAKYMTIINALEAKDYEGAVEEIYQMYLEDEGITEEGEGTADGEDESSEIVTAITPEVEFWRERVPGEYIGYWHDEDVELAEITLNADGTCTVNGNAYTWDFEKSWDGSVYYCYETNANVMIYDGDTLVYQLYPSLQEQGYVSASLNAVDEEGNINWTDGRYYNSNDLMFIELTVDNWLDYFEEVEYAEMRRNSFDEITDIYIEKCYLLKEEYGYVITDLSDVAIEYTYQAARKAITVDLESETYVWGEVTRTYDPYTTTSEMNGRWMYEESCYGFCFTSNYVDEFPEDEIDTVISLEMNRLKGTIYCVPVK